MRLRLCIILAVLRTGLKVNVMRITLQNGEFRTQLFTQVESEATESPQDSVENDVSDPKPVSTDSEEEGA